MRIERCTTADLDDLMRLRQMLWPECTENNFPFGVNSAAAFIVRTDAGEPVGFADATVRYEPVNGCNTRPVLFLEGIYVLRDYRRRGVGSSLCEATEAWGRSLGCSEFASDALLHNLEGHAFHIALGFEERERVVVFGKRL